MKSGDQVILNMCIRNHARMFNLASTTCPPGGGPALREAVARSPEVYSLEVEGWNAAPPHSIPLPRLKT